MPFSREPRIQLVPILSLRPTQITVGMREVEAKRQSWRSQPETRKPDFLGTHLIPVVWGPKGRHYIIDHHHLALALYRERVQQIATTVVADLRDLPRQAFWMNLDSRGWLHPFDADGQRRSYYELPKRISDLVDDPYRSLAGELRWRGGFAKDTTPFSEFLWAEFLRRGVKRRLVRENFSRALTLAVKLAKTSSASYLPGWCGPIDRGSDL